MTHTQTNTEASIHQPLREAFLASIHLFEELTETYQGLEGQVAALKQQLSAETSGDEGSPSAAYSNDVILAMASLAHQIRSPLMVAALYAEQLKSCTDTQKDVLADRITRSLQGLSLQLDELMQLAKGAQGTKQHFLLADFIDDFARDSDAWLPVSTVSIRWHNKRQNESILCRARRYALQGAISNVIHNAAQSKLEGVHIQCEFDVTREGSLLIGITDNGSGLSEAQRQSLFTPFATKREGGHGLGLCFARQIARAHGGELYLSHTSTKGSCFIFELPICCSPEPAAVEHARYHGVEE